MNSIFLGKDRDTGEDVELPVSAFTTHLHIPGATGKGKSTAIFAMLRQLLLDWRNPHCHVIVDFLGGLSHDLLLWMSTDRCTQEVRDRLVLSRPGNPNVTMTLNPLLYDDYDQGFFKVNRATELILRAWSAQSLAEQPRLARWLFNAMWACAQLGLTVADTAHLLIPGSPFHTPLLNALPGQLRAEWMEVLLARGGEAGRILESTRNRMKPFHESGILRRMFGSTVNRLDAVRFMREGKILILDLSPQGRLSPPEANAIAGLVINEFLAAARSLPRTKRYPTYLWLDEFQRFVSPDFEYAIPEVRQLGIRLILAHQSFSQLKTETTDLTSLIWQPQTRLVFGEQGEDADLLAHEFASIAYNPLWIKDQIYTLRQLQVGQEKVELSGWTQGRTGAETWQKTYGRGRGQNQSSSRRDDSDAVTRSVGESRMDHEGRSDGGNKGWSDTHSIREQLIAKLETTRELSSKQFYSFNEQRTLWAQKVRTLRTGQCILRVVDEERMRTVNVDQPKTGILALDPSVIERRFPEVMEQYEQLIETNNAKEWFALPAAIEAEANERLIQVLRPTPVVPPPKPTMPPTSGTPQPFEE